MDYSNIMRALPRNILEDVATSAGQVTGVARVIKSPEDFHKMRHGDIRVASITTPAWRAQADNVVQAVLMLEVSESITEDTDFSFSIMIEGTG
jgi:hypothetical protein